MKLKYFLVLFLGLFTSRASAVEILNYNDALTISKETDQKVLVYFGADWCKYCIIMKDVLYDNEVYQSLKDKNLIFVEINVDENSSVKKKYSVRSIPDIILINKNENILKRNKGYMKKEDFIKWIEN